MCINKLFINCYQFLYEKLQDVYENIGMQTVDG